MTIKAQRPCRVAAAYMQSGVQSVAVSVDAVASATATQQQLCCKHHAHILAWLDVKSAPLLNSTSLKRPIVTAPADEPPTAVLLANVAAT